MTSTTPSAMKSHTTYYKSVRTPKGTRIFKRNKNGTWTYISNIGGQRSYFPIGYDQKEAMELADKIRGHLILYPLQEVLDMFQKKRFAKTKAPTPKLVDVVTILDANRVSSGMSKTTLKSYLDGLRKFARMMTGRKDVGDFDLGTITDKMIRDFKTKSLDGITDQALIQSKKRTINSNIRQLKALFSRLSLFEDYDTEFVDTIRKQEFYKGLKKQCESPSSFSLV